MTIPTEPEDGGFCAVHRVNVTAAILWSIDNITRRVLSLASLANQKGNRGLAKTLGNHTAPLIPEPLIRTI